MTAPARTPVLFTTPVAALGGAERALAGLVRHLPAHGYEPHVVVLSPGPAVEWFREAGAAVLVIDAAHGQRTERLRWPGVVRRLRREIRTRHSAVVVSSLAKAQLYGGIAAATTGVPGVYWQHGIPRRRPLDLAARVIPAAAIVCGSEASVDAQQRERPRAMVRKVHPGIDLDAVRTHLGEGTALRAELGWGDRPAIGIVGRLEPWKGQRTFLHAAAQVAAAHPDLQITVVGGALIGHEGRYPQELRELAHRLGIGNRTSFVGHDDDVHRWYEALDVVVHASEEPEPFGLVIVEAMAMGAAVVATAGGGPLEIIEDGVSGMLVPIGDPTAMATAIGELLAGPERRASMGLAAQQRAERFTETQMAGGFADVLTEVLSRRGQRPGSARA